MRHVAIVGILGLGSPRPARLSSGWLTSARTVSDRLRGNGFLRVAGVSSSAQPSDAPAYCFRDVPGAAPERRPPIRHAAVQVATGGTRPGGAFTFTRLKNSM